jgi:hypothetical protein
MSGKPFDLEAAKKGDAVLCLDGSGRWVTTKFHGLSAGGKRLVVERDLGAGIWNLVYAKADDLCMAPKKVTWYCRHFIDGGGVPQMYRSRTLIDCTLESGDWHGELFTIEVEE